jgi:beta-barrel assembly-enhancing protease
VRLARAETAIDCAFCALGYLQALRRGELMHRILIGGLVAVFFASGALASAWVRPTTTTKAPMPSGRSVVVQALGNFVPASSPAQTEEASPALSAVQSLVAGATAKYQKGDAAGAFADLKTATSMEGFSQLPPRQQASILYDIGRNALQLKDAESAHAAAVRALALVDDNLNLWQLRLWSAALMKDDEDAALSLTTIAKRWPASLATLSDNYLQNLPRRVHGKTRFDLLQAMYGAQWAPNNKFQDPSPMWFLLVTALVDDGDLKEATAVSHLVENGATLVQMRADKRFDPITRAEPDRFDVIKAVEARQAKLRALSTAAPGSLEGVDDLAAFLLTTGKPSDAAAMLDDAIAKSHTDPGEKPYFQDADDLLAHTYELKAEALQRLGRTEDALKTQQRAAAHPEHGGVNVDQTLDLALQLDDLGRPREALEAVQDFDPAHVSSFGLMVWQEVRSCAYAQLDDQANLAKSIAYLKAHAADSPSAYRFALACAGDVDAYAKTLVADLENPDTRADALFNLQEFKDSPSQGPWDDTTTKRTKTAVARPEVQAEIKKVGRVETYPIYGR